MPRPLLALLLLCTLPACFGTSTGGLPPVRTSSRSFLSEEASRATTSASPEDTARRIVTLFSQRGLPLIDRRELDAGRVLLKFKGTRTSVQTRDSGESGFGSVYFVTLAPRTEGGTALHLFGKPTWRGRAVCTDHDGPEEPCEREVRGFFGTPLEMTGREESETVRGVIAELGMTPS